MDYRYNDNSQNTILCGHNMRNKTMFNNLLKFKDKDFFNKNNKIRVIKDDK
ncbi:sortase%2C SrtB family [uncultured Clostridium sp.]|nr:sortase%2C SrtB family [uncultured Clostridium sp.]SCJ15849.1 sortase%2C SrtB family [uncultured Clostridium sp.]